MRYSEDGQLYSKRCSHSKLEILGCHICADSALFCCSCPPSAEPPEGPVRPVTRPVRPVYTDLAPFFRSCPPSVKLFYEVSRNFFFCSNLGSPMTTFFPFVDSAWLGRIRTLGFCNSTVCTGKGLLSIWICGTTNHPSLRIDWICLLNTLQSLVAWENKLCHLQ